MPGKSLTDQLSTLRQKRPVSTTSTHTSYASISVKPLPSNELIWHSFNNHQALGNALSCVKAADRIFNSFNTV
uniref:Uncharacterized protein n=1 Tax=Megaselia scalaris TaxID=36166 RepID=T1GG29_MEGSC